VVLKHYMRAALAVSRAFLEVRTFELLTKYDKNTTVSHTLAVIRV
jgi:hypothetical protein